MQLIDALSPTFDPLLRQAFHDKTAGTVVVALPPAGTVPVDVPSGVGSSPETRTPVSPGTKPADHPKSD
jgi:hypothetical protein